MAKKIQTLIHDIESLLVEGVQEIPDELIKKFSTNVAITIKESLSKREQRATLRMSNIGQPCERKLWYEINIPEYSEPLRAETYMKFMYGHLIEELVLFLAELAGHEVTGRQDEIEIQGIKGHRDAVVDGRTVDVKSASTYSFQKFKNNALLEDDPFGYVTQIDSYRYGSLNDPLVTDKEEASFIVVDKTLGHLVLDTYPSRHIDFDKVFQSKKEVIRSSEPPARSFEDIPEGKSGNRKLGINCSYCPFKNTCWPGLRTFMYSRGPVYLTKVVYEPNVPELRES